MLRPRFLFVSLALCSPALSARAADLRLEASTVWAENIGRATAPSDWRDACQFELQTTYSQLREWQTGLTTRGELGVAFDRVPRFTKLDSLGVGAALEVRQKFGFGPYAPVLSLETGLCRREARLDDNCGWTATAGLHLGKRLTPHWRVAAIGDWEQHYARAAYYDTKHHRAFGSVTWDLNPQWSLTYGRGSLWGSFDASASWDVWGRALGGALGNTVASYYRAVPWEVTNTFGPGWVTYLVDGRVDFWWLELAPAIGRNTSLPLRYESRFSVNQAGVKYRQDRWSVQLLHRF